AYRSATLKFQRGVKVVHGRGRDTILDIADVARLHRALAMWNRSKWAANGAAVAVASGRGHEEKPAGRPNGEGNSIRRSAIHRDDEVSSSWTATGTELDHDFLIPEICRAPAVIRADRTHNSQTTLSIPGDGGCALGRAKEVSIKSDISAGESADALAA